MNNLCATGVVPAILCRREHSRNARHRPSPSLAVGGFLFNATTGILDAWRAHCSRSLSRVP
jgi:hypothetical protein